MYFLLNLWTNGRHISLYVLTEYILPTIFPQGKTCWNDPHVQRKWLIPFCCTGMQRKQQREDGNDHRNTVRSIYIRTLTQFSQFWLCTQPQWTWNWTWNETIKMWCKCRLLALIWGYLYPNQVNGVRITTHFIIPHY